MDIENGVMGFDYYFRMRNELLGDDFSFEEVRPDGAIYMGDGIWLTVDGEFDCDEMQNV